MSDKELKDAFDKARGDFANVNAKRLASEDNRHVYSASCSWNGPIAKVGSNGGLPACPHCGSMLLEMDADEWARGVAEYAESKSDPRYPKFIEWMATRGKCSPFRNRTDLDALRSDFNDLQTTMSEHQTPRTSAASFDIIWRNGAYHVTRADVGNMAVVSADLAEKLERESADRLALLLAAELREKALRNAMEEIKAAPMAAFDSYQAALARAKGVASAALAEPASPSPELAAMIADKERLDFLESRPVQMESFTRAAIDAARKGTP